MEGGGGNEGEVSEGVRGGGRGWTVCEGVRGGRGGERVDSLIRWRAELSSPDERFFVQSL